MTIKSELSDAEFIRYSRQLMVAEIGEVGQQQLMNAQVLVIGVGGLGSAAVMYLAAAGVGLLVIADDDEVEVSNLQRQVIYRDNDIATSKALAACQQINALNPLIRTRAVQAKLAGFQLDIEVQQADIVLDCSDNWGTRYAINQACFKHQKTLISGASIGWQGQLIAFDFRQSKSGCYQCLFPIFDSTEQQANNCRTGGVIGPVVGTIGNLQALTAIKAITGVGDVGFSLLQQFDGFNNCWQQLSINTEPHCPVCGVVTNQESV